MVQMGIGQDITCPLCGSHLETNAHLFFECEFFKACLEDTLKWMKTKQRNMVYYIWQARNDTVWNQKVPRTQTILQKIQMESKVRIFEILKRKHRCKDRYWIEQLYK
ncbi:hypothetical protein R3W88_029903 [Solanum pinnatisectum]|uniref:Reverse transcriptase zinc-binding domain-containing protein n=1 Tax=Solanum pinnatisectum TaxID=50273 RepID=A0AAV9K742_9SOLN|nr:hypothetical protein R3W88_029903 [Solanum pinnatisectum]